MATTTPFDFVRALVTDYDDQWKAAAYLGFDTVSDFVHFLCSHGFLHFFIRYVQKKPRQLPEDLIFSHVQARLDDTALDNKPSSEDSTHTHSHGSEQRQERVLNVAELLFTMIEQLEGIGASAQLDPSITERANTRLDSIYGLVNCIPVLDVKEVKIPKWVGNEELETRMEKYNRALVCLEIMDRIMSEPTMREKLPACLLDTAIITAAHKPWFMQENEEEEEVPEQVIPTAISSPMPKPAKNDIGVSPIVEKKIPNPPAKKTIPASVPAKPAATLPSPVKKVAKLAVSPKKQPTQPVPSLKRPVIDFVLGPLSTSVQQRVQNLAHSFGGGPKHVVKTRYTTPTNLMKLSQEAIRSEIRRVFRFKKWKIDFAKVGFELRVYRMRGKEKGQVRGDAVVNVDLLKVGWEKARLQLDEMRRDGNQPVQKIEIGFEVRNL